MSTVDLNARYFAESLKNFAVRSRVSVSLFLYSNVSKLKLVMGMKLLPRFPARRQVIVDCYDACWRQLIRTHRGACPASGCHNFYWSRTVWMQLGYQCALKRWRYFSSHFILVHAAIFILLNGGRWSGQKKKPSSIVLRFLFRSVCIKYLYILCRVARLR